MNIMIIIVILILVTICGFHLHSLGLVKKQQRIWIALSYFYKSELIERGLYYDDRKGLTIDDLLIDMNVPREIHIDILKTIIRKFPDYANLKEEYIEDMAIKARTLKGLSEMVAAIPSKIFWKKNVFKEKNHKIILSKTSISLYPKIVRSKSLIRTKIETPADVIKSSIMGENGTLPTQETLYSLNINEKGVINSFCICAMGGKVSAQILFRPSLVLSASLLCNNKEIVLLRNDTALCSELSKDEFSKIYDEDIQSFNLLLQAGNLLDIFYKWYIIVGFRCYVVINRELDCSYFRTENHYILSKNQYFSIPEIEIQQKIITSKIEPYEAIQNIHNFNSTIFKEYQDKCNPFDLIIFLIHEEEKRFFMNGIILLKNLLSEPVTVVKNVLRTCVLSNSSHIVIGINADDINNIQSEIEDLRKKIIGVEIISILDLKHKNVF